ncbi:MAG: hypothetical protein COT89_01745 [Candidatus Colwellbacteria bacterium CG10_big_fil_rev_8_21_14_0_10_42_22]|uniref:TrbL/VirB6 plasmid conjugal transfer protein n=1 Tax=Candidatus Colwellbacteria bacterium CG10_big_fil_rev_8_21_14_0_10_42_22 TaxID=1974540 RepID=A0A2H0VFS3_9BACT|nr:MAG: hypothetical protein COT89_01745 [Candidatus Colwellbacteria bacterium CG10_big_fil_rev_8_21_14_0_10_42_22]
MREFRKHILKALSTLVVLLVVGVNVEHALAKTWWNPLDWPSLIGGKLSQMAADIAEGIARLISGVLDIVAGIFYQLASIAVETSVQTNQLLPRSEIIKEGLDITLTITNMGLIVGVIVYAFAVITKADWIVDVKKQAPKFIATLILIQFSYFITMHLIVVPSNGLTDLMHQATNYTPESFRGTFNPNIDINPAVQQQVAMAKIAGGNSDITVPDIENYFLFREEGMTAIKESLDAYNNDGLMEGTVVTEAQKQAVARSFIDASLSFGGIFEKILGSDGDAATYIFTRAPDWLVDSFKDKVDETLGASGAPYKDLNGDIFETSSTKAIFVGNVLAPAFVEKVNERFSGCVDVSGEDYLGAFINYLNEGPCDQLMEVYVAINQELPPLDRITIAFAEVLFKTIFVFLGVISLLAIAALLYVRYVAISILIIVFPFVWIAWIFPKISSFGGGSLWSKWWTEFVRWVIFGPVMMFFLFLAVKLATTVDTPLYSPSAEDLAGFAGKSSLAITGAAVGQLLVVLGFLIGGLFAANKMGVKGSQMFYNAAQQGAKQIATRGSMAMARLTAGTTTRVVGLGVRTAGLAADPLIRAGGRGVAGAAARRYQQGGGGVLNTLMYRGGLRASSTRPVSAVGRSLERLGRARGLEQRQHFVVGQNGQRMNNWNVRVDANGNRTIRERVGNQWLDRTDQDLQNAGGRISSQRRLRVSPHIGQRLQNIYRDPAHVDRAAQEVADSWRSPFNVFGEAWRGGAGGVMRGFGINRRR